MIKRFLTIILAAVAVVFGAQAQIGTWEKYSAFAGGIDRVVDTEKNLYFLSSGSLYGYDKENDETYAYNQANKLSDNGVSLIRYNPEGGYLFIGYDNSNIDILFDDGRVVNCPDIKDATLGVTKTLRTVSFSKDRIYVSTSFGIVVFDANKLYVLDSGIYEGKNIQGVVEICGHVVVINGTSELYAAPKNGSIRSFTSFTKMHNITCKQGTLTPLGDNSIVFSGGEGTMVLTYDFSGGIPTAQSTKKVDANLKTTSLFDATKDGGLSFTSGDVLYKITPEGDFETVYTLTDDLAGNLAVCYDGPKIVWFANADGVANYDVSGTTLTQLQARFKPADVCSVPSPFYITSDESGRYIYISNHGNSERKPLEPSANGNGTNVEQKTTLILDGVMSDVSGYTEKKNKKVGLSNHIPNAPDMIAVDPDDPTIYYLATQGEGVYKIQNGKVLGQFYNGNSPIAQPDWIKGVAIDKEGNLWCVYGGGNSSKRLIEMLPAKFRKMDCAEVKASDWKSYGIAEGSKYDVQILCCKKSNMVFIVTGNYGQGVIAIDTKGTWDNINDDTVFVHSTLIDQDGNDYSPIYTVSLMEDNDGKIWVGTNIGPFIISDPQSAANQNMRVIRPKIPRNDGTNYADYLLPTDFIYNMCVDNSNRKWIATQSSGVYLVSPDGDKIIENFNMTNSILPTNEITTVYADKLSNKVYIGTLLGLYSYSSDSSPVKDNYDEVYAYPNPVRPEFSGVITIAGLMENSLVKIADSMGNVLYQTRSEGGMATWDGCDTNGNRVKTGVYYVFASQNENDHSSGAVTKILVVK